MKNSRYESKNVAFLKIASNPDLTLSDDGECLALLISCGIIDLGAFCVELWSFYCSKRISVPMSDIKLTYFGQCEQIDRRGCCEKLTNANFFTSVNSLRKTQCWKLKLAK